MNSWRFSVVFFVICITLIKGAVIPNDDDVEEQGLYRKTDHVVILTQRNFDKKVYGQRHALVIQFYNSYCGHCRAFAPKFKALANEIKLWRNVVQLAVVDCSVEENNEICRQFEIMAYPSLRYFHDNYSKGNANIGYQLRTPESAEKLKSQILAKLQEDKGKGLLTHAPNLNIASYSSVTGVLQEQPNFIKYTFLVFEHENSTVGVELALDINDYEDVSIKRVHDTSELAHVLNVNHFPGLVAAKANLETTPLTPKNPTKENLLNAINTFLRSINYHFPTREINDGGPETNDNANDQHMVKKSDVVYYADLEKTIKTSLHTEITRHKVLTGEPLQALMNYLNVILKLFPFKGNLGQYIYSLHSTLITKNEWSGSELYALVIRLEREIDNIYSTNLEYIGCKGSQPSYRGYSCGLWTLFHTLTVQATQTPGVEGPKVLQAMHGYIKHFFGCTECAQHFQSMAERDKLFDVKDNDKAVLWLWVIHNEVNLRLAGDITEDPEHPKVQYPSVEKCNGCRSTRGAWNLPAVYQYLRNVYRDPKGVEPRKSALAAPSPFSNLDIGMLSLLYILSFLLLILVIKYFLSKHFYRKRAFRLHRAVSYQ